MRIPAVFHSFMAKILNFDFWYKSDFFVSPRHLGSTRHSRRVEIWFRLEISCRVVFCVNPKFHVEWKFCVDSTFCVEIKFFLDSAFCLEIKFWAILITKCRAFLELKSRKMVIWMILKYGYFYQSKCVNRSFVDKARKYFWE